MKLSVIVPVYMVEEYLAKCLDSLILPDREDYEIIAVNDGSTDGCAAILEEYRSRYPRLIRVVTTENRGLGSARNTGIEYARGEFLAFIDADDYLAPGGMEGMLSCLDQDFDLCLFDAVSFAPDGRELEYIRGCGRRDSISLAAYPGLLLERPNAWNKLYRRSFFLDNGIFFPPRAWFEDLRTVLKLYCFADKILYVPSAWYRYLIRPGSITNSAKAPRNLEMIDAIDDLLAFFRERGCYERYRDELEYLAFHNEFLTSSVRVILADRHSPVKEALIGDFLSKFPDFSQNPYVKKIGAQHRLLTWLLLHKRWLSVYVLMRANNYLKRGT